MHRLEQKMAHINNVIAWGAGFALIAICLLIATEIFLRKVLNYSILGVDEISGYVLAVTSAWIFGFTAVKGAHIRVDSLINLLPSRMRPGLDLLASLSLLLLAFFLAYHAGNVFLMSFSFSSRAPTPLQTPLWIPQLAWFLGTAFFALTTFVITMGHVWEVCTSMGGQRPAKPTDHTGDKNDPQLPEQNNQLSSGQNT